MDDPQLVVVDKSDSGMEDEAIAQAKCKEIADTLHKHYPGHLWAVGWQGGIIYVKNLAISSHYGYEIHYGNSFSATELAKTAVQAGGELLERAKMVRGKWDGGFAESLEGSESRFFHPTLNR